MKRDREGDREKEKTQNIGKGGRQGFLLALILLLPQSLSSMVRFTSSMQLERKRDYQQSKPGAAEKQHSNLLKW